MYIPFFKTILCALLVLVSTFAFSQISEVKEIKATMSNGEHTGFEVLVPEANQKNVLKAWESLMKEYGAKTDKVKKSEEWLSEPAVISSLGNTPISVFVNFTETKEGIRLNAFFNMGSAYLSSEMDAQKATAAKSLLKEFAKNTARESVEEQLEKEQKSLEKLEKEQEKLDKEKVNYERDIQQAKELIATREKEIEQNIRDKEEKNGQVAKQKEVVEKTKERISRY